MLRKVIAGALALACLSSVALAAEGDIKAYDNVGNWKIAVDPSDNGCLMQTFYPSYSTVLRIGMSGNMEHAYVILLSNNWPSLQAGVTYPIMTQIDNLAPVQLTGEAVKMADPTVTALKINVANLRWVAGANVLRFSYNGNLLISASMSGSAQAITRMAACSVQSATNNAKQDPFATQPAVKSDPFERQS